MVEPWNAPEAAGPRQALRDQERSRCPVLRDRLVRSRNAARRSSWRAAHRYHARSIRDTMSRRNARRAGACRRARPPDRWRESPRSAWCLAGSNRFCWSLVVLLIQYRDGTAAVRLLARIRSEPRMPPVTRGSESPECSMGHHGAGRDSPAHGIAAAAGVVACRRRRASRQPGRSASSPTSTPPPAATIGQPLASVSASSRFSAVTSE